MVKNLKKVPKILKNFQKSGEKLKFIYKYEYVYFKITSIKKKFRLPYLLNIYLVLPDQRSIFSRLMRKEGYKIRCTQGEYQLLISKHNISYKSKLKLIEKLFKMEFHNTTLLHDLTCRFNKGAVPINSSNFQSTEYMLILDNLSTFLISNNDNSEFLTKTVQRRNKRYELFSYIEDIPYEFMSNLIINNKGLAPTHVCNSPKLQIRRWKKSKTYKLNKVREGMSKEYKAKWCYVDELNEFIFEGQKYKVESSEYYKKKYGKLIYDQILVFKDKGIFYFYNMDIEEIDKKYILINLK